MLEITIFLFLHAHIAVVSVIIALNMSTKYSVGGFFLAKSSRYGHQKHGKDFEDDVLHCGCSIVLAVKIQ